MSIYGNALAESGISENTYFDRSARRMSRGIRESGSFHEDRSFGRDLLRLEVQQLVSGLDDMSRDLFRFPSRETLDRYRSLVGQVLQKAEAMLDIKRDFSLDRGASMMLVERTRQGLKELEKVIEKQGKRARIMGITEEIRGCLVSLVV